MADQCIRRYLRHQCQHTTRGFGDRGTNPAHGRPQRRNPDQPGQDGESPERGDGGVQMDGPRVSNDLHRDDHLRVRDPRRGDSKLRTCRPAGTGRSPRTRRISGACRSCRLNRSGRTTGTSRSSRPRWSSGTRGTCGSIRIPAGTQGELVSRFRSSHTLAATFDANFGIKGRLVTLRF
jgi:hypothetical protein